MFIYLIEFLCGLGLFLFALNLLNNSFEEFSSDIEFFLGKRIKNPYADCLLGFVCAAITQSSSAINSILVGLADKDTIKRKECYFIIMGTNIGTTLTAYFALLGKFNAAHVFMLILFICALIITVIKDKKIKNVSNFLCIFSLLFVGLNIINNISPYFISKIDMGKMQNLNSFMLFFIAVILTALCQSSALLSVIIITMASYSILNLEGALFMIMGANLGTCSTALTASLGRNNKGASVAYFNLIHNFIGIILNLFLYYTGLLTPLINLNVALDTKTALFHTFFNVSTTLLIFPFINNISKIKLGKKTLILYD